MQLCPVKIYIRILLRSNVKSGDKYQYITDPPPKNNKDGVVTLINYIGNDMWWIKENNVSHMESGEVLHTRYKKIN